MRGWWALAAWALGGLASAGQAEPEVLPFGAPCPIPTPPMVVAPAPGPSISWQAACFRARIEVAGRGSLTFPEVGVSRRLELARGRFELGLLGPGPLSTRVSFTAVRSGGGTGYVGIAGEAIVPEFLVAEVRMDARKIGLSAAAGLIDDIWVLSSRRPWGLRWVSGVMSERSGFVERSDLGAWASWTSPRNLVSLTASLVTGEGRRARERNNGKDVTGVLTVRPLAALAAPPVDLEISAWARDGSRGAERARNHRAGVRIGVLHPLVNGGVEALWGWGQAGDPLQLPAGVSAFARTGSRVPVVAWARVDATWASRDVPDTRTLAWSLGGGPLLPWHPDAPVKPVTVALGYEGVAMQEGARALAGADAAAIGHTVFVQLGALLEARVGMTPAFGLVVP
jgi:hypothetical protein